MGTRENNVENYLLKEMKRIGGLSYKWTSPGKRGVPDRINIYKGNIYLVEVKTKDGEASSSQLRVAKHIFNQGVFVYFLDSHEKVNWFIRTLERINNADS
tara:strand:+ start:964 stop:1263 length:300 start_codon:yes stop_codon:yes gene_type:complete